jgi:hypothetical protein
VPKAHAQFSEEPSATPRPPVAMRFGESIEKDPRLRTMFEREKFFLFVVIPRFRTFKDARREWWARTSQRTVWLPCVLVLTLHVGMAIACTSEESGFCAAGPVSDDPTSGMASGAETAAAKSASWVFTEYGPPVINALAALLLSFYASVSMGMYKCVHLARRTSHLLQPSPSVSMCACTSAMRLRCSHPHPHHHHHHHSPPRCARACIVRAYSLTSPSAPLSASLCLSLPLTVASLWDSSPPRG